MFTVDKCEKRDFRYLSDNSMISFCDAALAHKRFHFITRRESFSAVFCNHHAFPCGEAVSLYNDGCRFASEIAALQHQGCEKLAEWATAYFAVRYFVTGHEILGECFARFELCGLACRSDDTQAFSRSNSSTTPSASDVSPPANVSPTFSFDAKSAKA